MFGASCAPHLVHIPSDAGLPQFPQKPLPVAIGILQFEHMIWSILIICPQLTQRFEALSLSVPQLGHGQYSSPQKGQNLRLFANFFEQLEQYTSFKGITGG